MRDATRVSVGIFGALAGLAGIEHGIGEVRQGNVAPAGLMISSWPDSELFAILGGEPAMTILPSLLLSGVVTIVISFISLVWATRFAIRPHGGLILILLSVVLLLVGGGFGPPLLGTIVGLAATRLNAPLTWWRARLALGVRQALANLWPWSLGVALAAWLLLLPGLIMLDAVVGVPNPEVTVIALTLSAFALLLVTLAAGLARDARELERASPSASKTE